MKEEAVEVEGQSVQSEGYNHCPAIVIMGEPSPKSTANKGSGEKKANRFVQHFRGVKKPFIESILANLEGPRLYIPFVQ